MSFVFKESPLGEGFNLDLTGRLKVSNPQTVFDSVHRYTINPNYSNLVVGTGATVGFDTTQNAASATIGTASGEYAYRESKRVFEYQSGKSLQIFRTFLFNPPKPNLRQRVGYFTETDGVFLEQEHNNVYIVRRGVVNGIQTDTRIPQNEWNVDPLDGTGPSGYVLSLTKIEQLWIEINGLGNAFRVGFFLDDENHILAHQFNQSNVDSSTFIRSANLPIRSEIQNVGITTSPSTLKTFAAAVISNGGYERRVAPNWARMTSLVASAGISTTTFTPLISIRLATGRPSAIVIPFQVNTVATASANNELVIEIVALKNGTLGAGTSFVLSDSSNVEFDRGSTTITGGTIIASEYCVAGTKTSVVLNTAGQYNLDLQIGRDLNRVSDVYTVAYRTITGSGSLMADIGFYDLT